MTAVQNDSGPTSNDLLRSLVEKHSRADPNYQIIAQSAEDVQNIENAPAVSMGPYLLKSGRTSLFMTISVYSLRQQLRMLYMNAAAVQLWKEMGKTPTVIGARNRPPHGALLTFGVPFSE